MQKYVSGVAMAAVVGMMSVPQSAWATNLIKDGGFEKPASPAGSYTLYSTGQTFSKWLVTGASGNVATISTSFTQEGFSFPAKSGKAWLDLTGNSNTATGVAQAFKTINGTSYTVTFWVGNVYDPSGIFGTSSTVNVYNGSTLLLTATNSKGPGSSKQVWQKFTVSFVAAAPKTTLSFINGDTSSDNHCGLDAVSVSPSALGMQ